MAAPAGGIQDRYLATLNLTTSEHINIYNKEIIGLPENDRYDLTRYKLTEFYQEWENSVSTFGLKAAFEIVTYRYVKHAPTEFNNVI